MSGAGSEDALIYFNDAEHARASERFATPHASNADKRKPDLNPTFSFSLDFSLFDSASQPAAFPSTFYLFLKNKKTSSSSAAVTCD